MTQINCLIALKNSLPALDAEGQEEVVELLDQELTYGKLTKMSMKDVYEFSLILPDIKMSEFFSREQLVNAGYMTKEEKSQAEFEAIYL